MPIKGGRGGEWRPRLRRLREREREAAGEGEWGEARKRAAEGGGDGVGRALPSVERRLWGWGCSDGPRGWDGAGRPASAAAGTRLLHSEYRGEPGGRGAGWAGRGLGQVRDPLSHLVLGVCLGCEVGWGLEDPPPLPVPPAWPRSAFLAFLSRVVAVNARPPCVARRRRAGSVQSASLRLLPAHPSPVKTPRLVREACPPVLFLSSFLPSLPLPPTRNAWLNWECRGDLPGHAEDWRKLPGQP